MTSPPKLTAETVARLRFAAKTADEIAMCGVPTLTGSNPNVRLADLDALLDWIEAAVPLLRRMASDCEFDDCTACVMLDGHADGCPFAALLAGFPEGG